MGRHNAYGAFRSQTLDDAVQECMPSQLSEVLSTRLQLLPDLNNARRRNVLSQIEKNTMEALRHAMLNPKAPRDEALVAETDELTADQLAAEEGERLESSLRRHFPFMKHDAGAEIARKMASFLRTEIRKQEPAMAASKACTGLLSLSAELRNRIYLLALQDQSSPRLSVDVLRTKLEGLTDWHGAPHWASYGFSGRALSSGQGRKDFKNMAIPPAIVQVSRQVRQEVLPMWLGRNEFCAWVTDEDYEQPDSWPQDKYAKLIQWLRIRGPDQVALIKKFSLYFDGREDTDLRRIASHAQKEREYHTGNRTYEEYKAYKASTKANRKAAKSARWRPLPNKSTNMDKPLGKAELMLGLGLQDLGLHESAVRVLGRERVPKEDFVRFDREKAKKVSKKGRSRESAQQNDAPFSQH